MKRFLIAVLALAVALSALTGCKDEPATIEGQWLSGDGSTLTLSEGLLTLTDSAGGSIISGAPLAYEHRGDFLYVGIDGVEVKAFEVTLNGDSLKLNYTLELQADMLTAMDSDIELSRVQD